MINSWWDFGEWSGGRGSELAIHLIDCPYCSEMGQLVFENKVEKKKPNDTKTLHFDTLKCGHCGNFVLIFWSAARNQAIHDYLTIPYSLDARAPGEWPKDISSRWVQAHRSLKANCWDAAVQMACTAMQMAIRTAGANGQNLKEEIEDLSTKGLLPSVMREWSHEIRVLRNDVTHPQPGQETISQRDAHDVVEFLDYMMQYLFTLPNKISEYRARRAP